MWNGPGLTRFAAVSIAVIEVFSPIAEGQSSSPVNSSAKASDSLLPREVVVPISIVGRFFPEITREASTGLNVTAVANAQATRSVTYANSNTSRKVTITVDEYSDASAASLAYQEAVAKSKAVPGFKPISAENLGGNALIGAVTQRGETHIGLGAVHDPLIVGATLAGYDPTPENTAKLVSLTRQVERVASAVVNRARQK